MRTCPCVCQGVDHWAVAGNRTLLFDPVASELPLLDVANGHIMSSIYKDNYNGWIKIGVVRDPVTRLLASYFDYVQESRREGRRLLGENQGLVDGVTEQADKMSGHGARATQSVDGWINVKPAHEGVNSTETETFAAFVDSLAEDGTGVLPAFRPMSALCGMGESPFDVTIPFERLQVMCQL